MLRDETARQVGAARGVGEPAPEGYMRDSQSRLVPVSKVKAEHKVEDDLVRELFREAETTSAVLTELRYGALTQIRTFVDLLADQYKAPRGGPKGNLTLSTFDGLCRIQIQVQDQISFGPELQVAKTLVDQCIRGWSEGANENLQAIVASAFAVDKEGQLNVGRILGLRRLEIHEEAWERAMKAIGDAIRVLSTKQYIRFQYREEPDGKWRTLPLDLAAV